MFIFFTKSLKNRRLEIKNGERGGGRVVSGEVGTQKDYFVTKALLFDFLTQISDKCKFSGQLEGVKTLMDFLDMTLL